ncbi:hypothetical protein SKAU_G00387050 [Synaphobranchus kaupii]|uniref:CCHC-type domain-containing protein n=1 Tax=Synaphobranchus kaupii TaxID=118154 RepID=A0A9Q1EAQ5_SYNKA|nr:hypothetical protein SKAU_G00387050 [Synaphobranchus kaupii]
MVTEGDQSVPRAGLRNTIRFQWRADGGIMPRENFGRAVLLGALNLKMEEVLCFQTNTLEKAYDITLSTSEVCLRVLEECRRRAAEKPVASFEIRRVAAFLRGFGEVLTEARKRLDSLGFWTGKRQFQVLLRPDLEGWEGFAHPPALFSIGADRGYLFYSRQPPYDRGRKAQGRFTEGSGTKECRRCGVVGHEAKNCPVPKACYGCGVTGHLAKVCPNAKPMPDEGPAGQEEGAQVEKRPPLKVRRKTAGGRKALSCEKELDAEDAASLWTAPWAIKRAFKFTVGDGSRPFAFGKSVPKVNQGMLTTVAMKALENLTGVLGSTDGSTKVPVKTKSTADKGEDTLKATAVPHKPVVRAAVLTVPKKVVAPPVSEPVGRAVDPPAGEISAGPPDLTEVVPTETLGEVPKQWGDCAMEGVVGPDGGATSPGAEAHEKDFVYKV